MTGPKFLDVEVAGTSPFDLMPLQVVPYAMWCERSYSVVEDSIESKHIRNGTIKLEDLEGELAFGEIAGTVAEGQLPVTLATDAELSNHANAFSFQPIPARLSLSFHRQDHFFFQPCQDAF